MILHQLIRYTNAAALEATWVDAAGAVVKSHAYANSQMDMLRADLGADAAAHEALIAEIEATYVPEPALPDPVPASVTRREGQRALLEVGKLDVAEAAIAGIADPLKRRAAQIEYEAGTWERASPFLVDLWQGMGGTLHELDSLFRLAKTL